MRIFGLVCFVGEVDDELGVALDDDTPNAERDGGFETADESLVFGDVFACFATGAEAELHRVVELVAGG